MIAWIIGIVFLLIISLLMSDEHIEPFEYLPPTIIPSKVRSDLTCSDPNASVIFDRYNEAKLELMGSNLKIPPGSRNARLEGEQHTSDTANSNYYLYCVGETDTRVTDYQKKRGTKVFIDKDERYNIRIPAIGGVMYNYNYVDLYCCKGEMFQPPGTIGEDKKVCLPFCPSNYIKSSSDETICIRNDSNCTYTADLSANIQNNWSKTCAALYKQNVNILSTINSISSVVSTFSFQTSTISTSYTQLYDKLSAYNIADSKKLHYTNNFSNIRNSYSNLYSNIQSNITQRYNTLKGDKLKFDTLFNNLGCSNYM